MPRHLLDLKGAKTIATAQLQLTCQLIDHLVADRSVGLVHGQAGTGKSFAVAAALEHTRAIHLRTVTLESHPSVRVLANILVSSFGDHCHCHGHCQGRASVQATRLLLDVLADQPPRSLLVIDQAQQLHRECIAYLRYLHEHDCDAFALLLVDAASSATGCCSPSPFCSCSPMPGRQPASARGHQAARWVRRHLNGHRCQRCHRLARRRPPPQRGEPDPGVVRLEAEGTMDRAGITVPTWP